MLSVSLLETTDHDLGLLCLTLIANKGDKSSIILKKKTFWKYNTVILNSICTPCTMTNDQCYYFLDFLTWTNYAHL